MEINSVGFINSAVKIKQKNNQTFGNTAATVPYQQSPNYKIPEITPQYNISSPIAYSHVEDIKLPNNMTAHYYKLANGQKVVIVPKQGSTVVKTYVNTGSLNEPDNIRGISHYIEHNLFNGSEALGDKDFFDEVNKMGAYTNASTSFSTTNYFISSNLLDENDLENKIRLQAGMLQTPKFLNEKLAKEKKIVDSEINMCLSDDASRAETLTLKNLFNIKSTSPDLVAGSTDNIDALTREDVINYFNNNYYPANMVTVITGEVEPEDTMRLVSKYFNSTKVPSASRYYEVMTPIDKPVRQDLVSSKTMGAAKIFLGFAGPRNDDNKDKVYLRAVNELLFGLNSAKIKKLEQKYSTEIFANSERMGTRGQDRRALLIESAVPENYVEPLLKDLYALLEATVNNPPTEDEFEAIKNNIKKSNSIFLQSSNALNYHIGHDFLDTTTHATADYADIIDKMTYKDFVDTAKKYYDLNKVSLTVVHPTGTSEDTINSNFNKAKAMPVSFTGAMKKVPLDIKRVNEYTLNNNFDVTLEDADTDVINYSIVLNTDFNPEQKPATADILLDMLQNSGTKKRSKEQIDAIMDKNGIEAGLYSGNRGLSLSGDSNPDKMKLALDIFKEKIMTSDLTQEDFEKSVQHCRDYYMTIEPSANEGFRQATFKNTPLGISTEEKLKSLDNITLQDVQKLYNDILNNAQGHIVVTAPFAKYPELKQEIFNSMSEYNKVKPKNTDLNKVFEPVEKSVLKTIETKRNQAEVLVGYKFNINGNVKDEICLEILNQILGGSPSSRLFTDLRETRHLAYSVRSSYGTFDDIGVIKLAIETTTNNLETGEKSYDNIKKSIDGFRENVERIKSEKVSENELETAKKALKTIILENLEMYVDKNTRLSNSVATPYGINYINEKFDMIDSITTDDILNTAKHVFKQNPVYSISGTKDALEANAQYLNSLIN